MLRSRMQRTSTCRHQGRCLLHRWGVPAPWDRTVYRLCRLDLDLRACRFRLLLVVAEGGALLSSTSAVFRRQSATSRNIVMKDDEVVMAAAALMMTMIQAVDEARTGVHGSRARLVVMADGACLLVDLGTRRRGLLDHMDLAVGACRHLRGACHLAALGEGHRQVAVAVAVAVAAVVRPNWSGNLRPGQSREDAVGAEAGRSGVGSVNAVLQGDLTRGDGANELSRSGHKLRHDSHAHIPSSRPWRAPWLQQAPGQQ